MHWLHLSYVYASIHSYAYAFFVFRENLNYGFLQDFLVIVVAHCHNGMDIFENIWILLRKGDKCCENNAKISLIIIYERMEKVCFTSLHT